MCLPKPSCTSVVVIPNLAIARDYKYQSMSGVCYGRCTNAMSIVQSSHPKCPPTCRATIRRPTARKEMPTSIDSAATSAGPRFSSVTDVGMSMAHELNSRFDFHMNRLLHLIEMGTSGALHMDPEAIRPERIRVVIGRSRAG